MALQPTPDAGTPNPRINRLVATRWAADGANRLAYHAPNIDERTYVSLVAGVVACAPPLSETGKAALRAIFTEVAA